MGKSKSDAINFTVPLKVFDAELYFFNDEVDLSPYLNVAKEPVCKDIIYGQSIEQLLNQLSTMSQLLGWIELLRATLYETPDKAVSTEDELVLKNVSKTVNILKDVIVEKFGPRVR
jgi:hypothetical protein